MKHSFVSHARRAFLSIAMLGVSLGSSICNAQTAAEKSYIDISPPQLVSTTNKIEVVEVFSYGCIHCANFQPKIDEWRKRLKTDKVEFVYLPSPYNPQYQLLARGYYAAESLGVAAKTHHGVFNAIHEQGVQVRSLADVAGIYADLGVARDDFMKAAQSFLVDSQVRRAAELMGRYRVDSTPTLLIAGKYRVTADSAGGQDNMLKVADQLIAKESSQTGTSRQAPNKGK